MLARLERVPRSVIAVPQPVFAEIAYGIERLPKSKKKDRLRQRYELIRAEFLPALWTEKVSEEFGKIKAVLERKGQRIEDFDAAIAAHAVDDDAILVSADTSDMARIPGINLEDWSSL